MKSAALKNRLIVNLALSSIVLFCSAGIHGEEKKAAAVYGGSGDCLASTDWIANPAFPAEINNGGQNNCDFQQFAWQSFFAAVQPTDKNNTNGQAILEFESWMPSYGIFVAADQSPTPWGEQPDLPDNECANAEGKFYRDNPTGSHLNASATDQAGAKQPLLDQNSNYVFYDISVNQKGYDFITQCNLYKSQCTSNLAFGGSGIKLPASLAFPANSIELKTGWKILSGNDKPELFYRTQGNVVNPDTKACQTVELGLVGMHLVISTPQHPEFIWATFEHKNNAPDCSDISNTTSKATLGGPWNFYNPACSGDQCALNTYFPGHPGQVCRINPDGNPTNTSGLSQAQLQAVAENGKNINSINASAQALVSHNSGKIDSIWANYGMTGNVWTINGALPPSSAVQAGSLSAANTTMETYLQNGLAEVNPRFNCFGCHTIGFGDPPAGLSHIFDEVVPNSGGCASGTLPSTCPVH